MIPLPPDPFGRVEGGDSIVDGREPLPMFVRSHPAAPAGDRPQLGTIGPTTTSTAR